MVIARSERCRMLDTLLLLIACVGVWLVILWSLRNDNAMSISDQRGLFRIRAGGTDSKSQKGLAAPKRGRFPSQRQPRGRQGKALRRC